MKRRFRLTRSNEIKRVRREGRSYAHPLVVLVVQKTNDNTRRIAMITGRSVGGAVDRNRIRRRLKAICDMYLPIMNTGFEAILIARSRASQASFQELSESVKNVFNRAQLLCRSND
ncbi:MAG: ribonuclease P protein component [Leptolinea sp.]|nr:ribonuclease P protein component [Leptolinea sp.]